MSGNWQDTANRYADLLDEHEQRMQTQFGHIPIPGDAIDTPSAWLAWDDGLYGRGYTCYRRTAAGYEVAIDAWQFSTDRPIEREIVFTDTNRGSDLTAEGARAVGRLLLEAADVLDRLSATEATVTR